MQEESTEKPVALRSGFTTGACATATAVAAAMHLLGDDNPDQVTITLPRGKRVDFDISGIESTPEGRVRASTVKDAGDDPDVTHGATVFCELALNEQPGVRFHAAKGVGTVTREGLELAVGECLLGASCHMDDRRSSPGAVGEGRSTNSEHRSKSWPVPKH